MGERERWGTEDRVEIENGEEKKRRTVYKGKTTKRSLKIVMKQAEQTKTLIRDKTIYTNK